MNFIQQHHELNLKVQKTIDQKAVTPLFIKEYGTHYLNGKKSDDNEATTIFELVGCRHQ